jgi:nitrate reductase assembly molybdenum cofactor insertion protein NarJ
MRASAAVDRLLREAAEWRLIGLLFEYPRAGWSDEVAALASQVSDAALLAAAAEAGSHGGGPYLATLGPGGAVPPREVGYRLEDPGRILAELLAAYAAFGYRPDLSEPPDHVAMEAGFVGYLKFKEAFALARDAQEEAGLAAEAERAFLAEHLAVMAERLARRLAVAGPRVLALAGEALLHRVRPPAQPVPAAGPRVA